jgi:hypothetical protein
MLNASGRCISLYCMQGRTSRTIGSQAPEAVAWSRITYDSLLRY